jgi:hypothetical protein
MVTVEAMIGYFERLIAEYRLSGDRQGLLRIQTAAGMMMQAAQAAGDAATARRLHVLAAQAANQAEEAQR